MSMYRQISNFLLNLKIFPKMVFLTRNWYLVLLDAIGLVHNSYLIFHRGGLTFKVRPGTADKAIYKEIFILDEYRKIAEDLSKAKVVIDVGAHVGFFSVYAAARNAISRIYAVEPVRENYQLLNENIQINRLQQRIIAINAAVWSSNRKTTLYLSTINSGGHSLMYKSENKRIVNAYTLNHIIQKYRIKRVDVLKLDCEGSEYAILMNLSKKIMLKIDNIIMEFHDKNIEIQLVSILRNNGFTIEFQNGFNVVYAHKHRAH